jgi:hypothetical protein
MSDAVLFETSILRFAQIAVMQSGFAKGVVDPLLTFETRLMNERYAPECSQHWVVPRIAKLARLVNHVTVS